MRRRPVVVPLRPRGGAAAERRRAASAWLRQAGLPGEGRPRREAAPGGPELARRLATALPAAGPLFAAFGRYLSLRPDLLAPEACLELAAVAPPPSPARPELDERLRREWRSDPALTLAAVEPEPRPQATLLGATYRARGVDGSWLLLTFAADGAGLAAELEALAVLAPTVDALDPARRAADVLADFAASLASGLDLAAQADALDDLAAEAPELLVVPRSRRDLSTPSLLVRADSGGLRLAAATVPPALDEARRRLGSVSLLALRQTLFGRVAPSEIDGEQVELLADGRVAFLAAPLWRPAAAAQEAAWRHLVGLAEGDEATAGRLLIAQLEPLPGAVGEQELLLRLRQVVPFRDGAWSESGDGLCEQLFAQWRLARASGYRLRPEALALARAVAAVSLLARRLDPVRDPLRETVEELALSQGVERLRGLLDPGQAVRGLLPQAGLVASLPEKLDGLLTLAAARAAVSPGQGATPRRRGLAAAVAAATVAAGLLLDRVLAASGLAAGAGEPWSALLLFAGGLLLLRALGRAEEP